MINILRGQLKISYSVFSEIKHIAIYDWKDAAGSVCVFSKKGQCLKIDFYGLESIFGKVCLSFFDLK